MAIELQSAFAFGEEDSVEDAKVETQEVNDTPGAPGSIDWYAAKQREYWNAAFPHRRK